MNHHYKIPHAYQQIVSHEKIPTLCHTLPAFEALKQKWSEYIEENPEVTEIVQCGLDKLNKYSEYIEDIPAYILALGMYFII